ISVVSPVGRGRIFLFVDVAASAARRIRRRGLGHHVPYRVKRIALRRRGGACHHPNGDQKGYRDELAHGFPPQTKAAPRGPPRPPAAQTNSSLISLYTVAGPPLMYWKTRREGVSRISVVQLIPSAE